MITHEVLVGKILHEYYLLPDKQQTVSKFLTTRRFYANYYLKDQIKVDDFIHRFREIKDEMKVIGDDGQTTMRFVLNLFMLNECSKEIMERLNEREIKFQNKQPQVAPPITQVNKVEQNNFQTLKDKFNKQLKKVKRNIYSEQFKLEFSY